VQHYHRAVPAAARTGRVCLFVVDSPRHIALRSTTSSSDSSDSDGQLAEKSSQYRVQRQGTKVCRYSWHSAGSPAWKQFYQTAL